MFTALIASIGAVIALAISLFLLHRKNTEDKKTLHTACQTAIKASAAKDEFMAVMSHELRTPLTAVMGYTELLIDEIGGPVNKDQKDMLERIDISSKHLLCLIEQVLDIGRAHVNKLVANYQRCDVRGILANTVTILQTLADQKKITFYVNAPLEGIKADTDPAKLRQILINVVGNAVKFTEHGSVTVELLATHSLITLYIRDTGIGIRPEVMDRIFEPFFQGDGSKNRSQQGAGLGLTITHELVTLLGGTIRVQSEVDIGTEIRVILPRYQEKNWAEVALLELPPPASFTAIPSYRDQSSREYPTEICFLP